MKRRLGLAIGTVSLLLQILGCMCGPDTPPRANCDDADDATVDSIELTASAVTGGQGSDMLFIEVFYMGPTAAPECAALNYTIRDPSTGNTITTGSQPVQTSEVPGGRRTREPFWMFWDFPNEIEVTVEAYGASDTMTVCNRFCFDAGTPDAGGPDAGRRDAGGIDAGEPDAGDVDAGDLDAGDVDAGDVDAGDVDAG
ncbi:MAG: hypothetical protein AB7S26_17060 [Sandaracinaceae bacterium]